MTIAQSEERKSDRVKGLHLMIGEAFLALNLCPILFGLSGLIGSILPNLQDWLAGLVLLVILSYLSSIKIRHLEQSWIYWFLVGFGGAIAWAHVK